MKSTVILGSNFTRFAAFLGAMALVACWSILFSHKAAAAEGTGLKTLSIRKALDPLKIEFEPIRPSFKAGEPVRFRIKGNKDFFLYLFSINREQRRAVRLIPSSMQSGNKYKAERTFLVPNPNISFYAEKPGTEQVVMVASTRYLNLSADGYEKSGDFFTTTPEFADHRIKSLRFPTARKKEQPVVKELSLRITGKPRTKTVPRPLAIREGPMAFISCDREAYRLEDRVRVAFGADRPGWIYVYLLEPGGKSALFKKQAVSGKKVYHMTAKAKSPTGHHTLMAVFSESAELDSKNIPVPETGFQSKGLSLVSPEQPPYAVYRFHILAY